MKQTIIHSAFFLVSFFSLSSCASQKERVKGTAEFSMPVEMIRYTRGACFGKCPVFELLVFDDGKAILEGKMHLNHTGFFDYTLTPEELDEMKSLLDKTDFASMEDTYYGEIADVPAVGLTVRRPTFEKKIGGNWQFPDALTSIFRHLDQYVESEKWLPMMGKNAFYLQNRSIIPDRIITDLDPKLDPEIWIKSYTRYGARIVKRIAPRLHLYVIGFDPNAIHPGDFLEMVQQDSAVNRAEFDKALKMREK